MTVIHSTPLGMKIVPDPAVMPKILLSYDANLHLTAWKQAVGNLEFSGLGEVTRDNVGNFVVNEVYLMDVGTPVFTDIPPESMMALPSSDTRKLWFHRHPVGDGIAGPHNWSGTDHHTATREPLGGIPQMVKWSLAIVCTPFGWTGRIDFHKDDGTITYYVEVLPNAPSPRTVTKANKLITPALKDYIKELQDAFRLRHKHGYRAEDDGVDEDNYGMGFQDEDLEVRKARIMKELKMLDADDQVFEELDGYV